MPGRAQCSRVLATGLWRVQDGGGAAAASHRALPITAGKVIVDACQLAPITSPACGGEPAPDLIRGRIALCAMREGADAVAITPIPPPHPSPASGGGRRLRQGRRQPSAASSSLPAASARIRSAIGPAFCRIAASILAATSGLALRKPLAFSRPWPMRWLSYENQAPDVSTTP